MTLDADQRARSRIAVDRRSEQEPREPDQWEPDEQFEIAPHVLPPERPFAGDDMHTLELLDLNAHEARLRRRRVRRIGLVAAAAVAIAAVQPFLERTLGAW